MTKPEPTKFLICGLSRGSGAAASAADTVLDDGAACSSFLTEILTTVGNTRVRTLEIPGITSSACTGMEANQTTTKARTGHPRKGSVKPHRLMIDRHHARYGMPDYAESYVGPGQAMCPGSNTPGY